MFQSILNFYILILGVMFTQMSHPLTIGMMLLIQTFLISLLIGLIHKTFWFSYILFLIFVGGMLIMFIYVTSLSSNEMFFMYNKSFYFILIASMIPMLVFLFDLNYFVPFLNIENLPLNNNNIFYNENMLNLSKLYNFPTNLITMFMIIYLFITLIIVVKITNFFYGPLRPSFN